MKRIVHKEFYSCIDRGSPDPIQDVVVEDCLFDFCSVSETVEVTKRTTVRNLEIRNCTAQNHTGTGPAILEEIVVDGLSTPTGLVILWGPVFRHVTFRGSVGQIKINSIVHPDIFMKPLMQPPFDDAKKKFYANCDWALDISQAEFQECEITGVPVHLVRRDPETQAVVRREVALSGDWWKEVNPDNHWIPHIKSWVEYDKDEPSLLLVTPKAIIEQDFIKYLRDLQTLRAIGLADPE